MLMWKGRDDTHRMPRRKTTKVMLPCVIEFHCANAYLRSSGRPTQDQIMLPACVVTGCRRVDGWAARAVSGPSVDVRANVHGWSAVATETDRTTFADILGSGVVQPERQTDGQYWFGAVRLRRGALTASPECVS